MKGKLYNAIKRREEIESSQIFNSMIQRIEGTNSVVIDGRNLMANSIYAKHIESQQITADHLKTDAITANLIKSGGLELSKELKLTRGKEDILFIDDKGDLKLNVNSININMKNVEEELNSKAPQSEMDNVVNELGRVEQDRVNAEQELRGAQQRLEEAQGNLDGAIGSEKEQREADIIKAQEDILAAQNAIKKAEQDAKEYADAQDKVVKTDAATDATTKANNALRDAKTDATLKSDAAIEAAEILAIAKANAAKAAAIADSENLIGVEREARLAQSLADLKTAQDHANAAAKTAREAAEKYAKEQDVIIKKDAKKDTDSILAGLGVAGITDTHANIVADLKKQVGEKITSNTNFANTLDSNIKGNTATISALRKDHDGLKINYNKTRETAELLERVIGSEEVDSTGKLLRKSIASHVMSDSIFQTTITSVEDSAKKYTDEAKSKNYGYRYYEPITVYGDSDKYYPVIIKGGNQDVKRDILVMRGYSELAPPDWHNPTHRGGLTLKIKTNFGGWGGANYSWEIHEFEEQYSTMFAGAQRVMSSMAFAIFLRGGGTTGARYHIYSDQTLTDCRYSGENGIPCSPQIGLKEELIGISGQYSWNAPKYRTEPNKKEIKDREFIKLAQTTASDVTQLSNSYAISIKNADEIMSELSLVDNNIKLKGQNISLDGSTKVLGSFKVKGDMLANYLDVSDFHIRANDGRSTVLSITSTGEARLNVNSLKIGTLDIEKEIKDKATKKELQDIELTPGPKGDKGAPGKGIASTTVSYTYHNSGTAAPNSGWQGTMPPLEKGKYLWTRTFIKYTDGTDSTTYSVAYQSVDGRGIASTTITYAQTTSGSTTPTSWSTTKPPVEQGKYLWTKTEIKYSDGKNPSVSYNTSYSATDGQKGDKGDTGSRGPQGAIGATGVRGPNGPAGKDGVPGPPTYTWIAYADNTSGSGITTDPRGKDYVGYLPAQTSKDVVANSTNAGQYQWQLVRGAQGPTGSTGPRGNQGIQGGTGPKGDPVYTWIKYADTPTSGMNDDPTDKKYIGMAHNKLKPEESTNYDDYTWSLMPQNIEIGGRNLVLNSKRKVKNATYNIATYPFAEGQSPKENEIITITITGSLGADRTGFRIYNSGGSVSMGQLSKVGDNKYSITGPWRIGSSSNVNITVYQFVSTSTSVSTIESIMVEKGNVATDWTPAPEDIDKRLTDLDFEMYAEEGLISQKVSGVDYTGEKIVSKIILKPETVDILSENINLTGKVSFNSFNKNTKSKIDTSISKTDKWSYGDTTEIDGGNIRTSTLSANKITTGLLRSNNGVSQINMDTGAFSFGNKGIVYNGSDLILNVDSLQIKSADVATSKDVDDKIENIEIGGRNLVHSFLNASWAYEGPEATYDYRYFARAGSADEARYPFTFNPGETYTLSYESNNMQVLFQWVDGVNETHNIVTGNKNGFNSHTFTIPVDAYGMRYQMITLTSEPKNLELLRSVWNLKLEKGNKATDWSASPEDMDSMIGTVDRKIKDVDRKINNATTTIDGHGVTVKDGSFFLEDNATSSRYSLTVKPNLIHDHGFEFIEAIGRVQNAPSVPLYNVYVEKNTGRDNNIFNYNLSEKPGVSLLKGTRIVGRPYLFKRFSRELVWEHGVDYSPIFGDASGVISKDDYYEVTSETNITPYGYYTASAYFMKMPRYSAGRPTINIMLRDKFTGEGTLIKSEVFQEPKEENTPQRNIVTFKLPSDAITGKYYISIILKPIEGVLIVDGVQLVEGKEATQYSPENSAHSGLVSLRSWSQSQ